MAGPEVVDRVRFARELAGAFGLDPGGIVGKTTAELAQGAPRPLSGGLLITRLESWQSGAMRPLAQSLPDFVTRVAAPEGWAQP